MASSPLHESYQARPYPSWPVPLSRPDHLYVVGRLHGLAPAMVSGARVRELGCGTGDDLQPMAATLLGGQFVGIDLSERQIHMAQTVAEAANLGNVEFLTGDALSLATALARWQVQQGELVTDPRSRSVTITNSFTRQ